MTINQLKYFVTAANCLNFTEAGKIHYISQTAITQHIQSLEEQLGVKLFLREKRKVSLTPAGKVFLEEARAILERTRIGLEKTKNAALGDTGTLNIGYLKGYENSSFPMLIKNFRELYPNIEFSLYREAHNDLIHKLEEQQLDIAFGLSYPDADLSHYNTKILGRQRLYAVLYPTHPFANQKSLKRADLKNERFVLTKKFDAQQAIDQKIPKLYMDAGYLPNTINSSTDPDTLAIIVASGAAISIFPEYTVKLLTNHDQLVFIPLEGEDEYLNMVARWKKDNDNPALKRFLDIL